MDRRVLFSNKEEKPVQESTGHDRNSCRPLAGELNFNEINKIWTRWWQQHSQLHSGGDGQISTIPGSPPQAESK
jgi:hypothetical protein